MLSRYHSFSSTATRTGAILLFFVADPGNEATAAAAATAADGGCFTSTDSGVDDIDLASSCSKSRLPATVVEEVEEEVVPPPPITF